MGKILGIDIGHHQLKLALLNGNTVLKTVTVQLPENLVTDNKIISIDVMGDILRNIMKTNHIRCRDAAVVLMLDSYYLRTVSLPVMTQEQLCYNLPYEFSDYINDDLNGYLFDYAMQSDSGSQTEEDKMTVLTAAVPKSVISNWRAILRKAGLKMVIASPAISGIAAVLRNQHMDEKEYGILDLGYTSTRLHIFKGDTHTVTRVYEHGIFEIVDILAAKFQVDRQTALSYLETDHDSCTGIEECQAAFSEISIDLMRAINFHKFSNPDSMLQDIWLCGGGSMIKKLIENIQSTIDLNIHMAGELLDQEHLTEDGNTVFLAAAIACNHSEK